MTERRIRAAYTIIEVLMAMAIFLVLIVPLAWTGIQSANGKARARRIDDAVALSREDWGVVRKSSKHQVRDTSYERILGSNAYRIDRVVDTAGGGLVSTVQGLSGPARSRTWTAVRTCVVSLARVAGNDSSRCYVWRIPSVRIQP